jgi:peptidoglycan/xylan/chitin deacetylase (PgdA/CDA1 family)
MTRRLGVARRLRAGLAPFAKQTLLRMGGYDTIRRLLPSRRLAILRYHAICGTSGYRYADPGICITPEAFEQHVSYLTRRYAVLNLEGAVARLIGGKPLPRNAVAITFDDGYADNLAAARTLAKYGATATFYITAGCLAGGQPFWPAELRHLVNHIADRRVSLHADNLDLDIDLSSDLARAGAVRRLAKVFKSHPIPVREALREQLRACAHGVDLPRVMLTWDEVREMHALGMTIGSHTMTHPNLPSAGLAAARHELAASKARLEAEISAPVTMFSYPNGGAERYQTPELQQVLREVGYAAAVTSRNAFADQDSNVYALERIEVEESLADLVFALEVERFVLAPTTDAAEPPEWIGEQTHQRAS